MIYLASFMNLFEMQIAAQQRSTAAAVRSQTIRAEGQDRVGLLGKGVGSEIPQGGGF